MSFDFGEEQLTQPSLDISEPQGHTSLQLFALLRNLSCGISELSPSSDGKPLTIYLGGDAVAVFNNLTYRSVDGLRIFVETQPEASLIARIVDSPQVDNEVRIQLAARTLQAALDAVPLVKQTLVADAASIEPIYSCPALKVIIPRWEMPYAIKIHELASVGHDDSSLRWASQFLVFYLHTTMTGALLGHILESSVQEHIHSFFPQEKGPVHRMILDKVNRQCKEHFDIEPILFEG